MTKVILSIVGLSLIGLVTAGSISSMNNSGGKKLPKSIQLQDTEIVTPVVDQATPHSLDPSVKVNKLVLKDLDIDSERTLFIRGEITDEGMENVTNQLILLGKSSEPIYIIIDSPGGSVSAGERFISAMQSSKGKTVGICLQLCASMASSILEFADVRLGVNRSVLMFHDASLGGLSGYLSHVDSQLNLLKRKIEKLDNFVCNRIKMKCSDYKQGKLAQIWLDAEDSKQQGFLDNVIKNPELPPVTELNSNIAPTSIQFKFLPNNFSFVKEFKL